MFEALYVHPPGEDRLKQKKRFIGHPSYMKCLLKYCKKFFLIAKVKMRAVAGSAVAVFLFLASLTTIYCGSNLFRNLQDYNTTPFYLEILAFTPSNGETEVLLDAVVSVGFNDSINMSTLDLLTTFVVSDGTSTASGVFSFDSVTNTVTFTPSTNFTESTDYTVTLTTGIRNLSGDSMTADFSWGFSTIYYLKVVTVYPSNGAVDVTVNSPVEVIFEDNIDMLTVDASTTFIVSDGVTNLNGTFVYDSALKRVTFAPTGGFSSGTLYTVTMTTGIKNPLGESMITGYSWSFTTATATYPDIYVTSPLGGDMITGDTYDFGSLINPDTRSAVFTIGNSGNATLNISAATVTGVNSSEFVITSAPGSIVTSGGTTTVTIQFTPDALLGTKTAALEITSDDPDENPFVVNLTGISLSSTSLIPEIQITKSGVILVTAAGNVDFGSVVAGDTQSIAFVIYNLGTADLVISDVTISGLNFDLFSTDFTTMLPYSITPGSTYTFNVMFSPIEKVNAKATLAITSNDADESPFIVSLRGRCK